MSKSNKAFLTDNSNNRTKLAKNGNINQNQLFEFNSDNSCNTNNLKESFQTVKQSENNDKKPKISGPLKGETDFEKQLLYYFKDKRIYIEIFNDTSNSSQIFYDLISKYKIIHYKKLSKKIDYIVFKDGPVKTKRYAALNNIKMVNPLWIDDKVNKHIFKDDKEYEIKTNFSDIILIEQFGKNNDENVDTNILNKNYEVELEVEHDIELANSIDKTRENIAQKNNMSEMTTINDDYDNSLIEMKDNTKNDNLNVIEVKREKRIDIYNSINKLENRQTIMTKNIENDVSCQNNQIKNIDIGNNNNNNKEEKKLSQDKDNSKNQQKKKTKKNKKGKSSNKTNSNKNSQKNSEKKKKSESIEKNYILELNQNNSKVLGLATKNEIKTNLDSEKINIMTYKLEEKEIQCVKEFLVFEYIGNLNNIIEKDQKIYNLASIIILEKKSVIYDWKMYDFLLDKKIIIDFASFLLEFDNIDNNNDKNKIIEKINKISINNEIYFFNKKMRIQKRNMIQSLNIIENIKAKNKKEQINQQLSAIENNFFFMIDQDINENEKKVFHKLLKFYLKANIINTNMPKNRSRSVSNQINMNLEKLIKKNKKTNNLEVINENELNNKEINTNEKEKKTNEIDKSKNLNEKRINNINKVNDENKSKDKLSEEQNTERTFLISKNKVNNKKFLNKVKYYKGVISFKYIYDSFLNGQLLDLNEKEIYEKYKLE